MNLPFYDETESWGRTLSEGDIYFTHTHIKKKKSLAQIKLKVQGFSHLVTFWVGPFGAAGGHKEDTFHLPLPSPNPAVRVEDGVCGDL